MHDILVSGVPRAGKSSFADFIEDTDGRFTHVPLDKYILPVPESSDFLSWVRYPTCVDWDLLSKHMDLLLSGSSCRTPQVSWDGDGQRVSDGGLNDSTVGRLMRPADLGYLMVGTHSFSYRSQHNVVRVFIETPLQVVASRQMGSEIAVEQTNAVIEEHFGPNPGDILAQKRFAEVTISGTLGRREQYEALLRSLGL